jgi:hypothetical protein
VDRGVALPFRDVGARRGLVVSTTPWPLYPRERPGTHCTGGWVGPRAGLDLYEKSRPHRDSIPNRPARSQSLYRLSYPAHIGIIIMVYNIVYHNSILLMIICVYNVYQATCFGSCNEPSSGFCSNILNPSTCLKMAHYKSRNM